MDDLCRIVEKVAYKVGRVTRDALGLAYIANEKFWEGLEGKEDAPSDDAKPMPGETERQ